MKTYLEYKDEKSQKFWEVSVSENNIITRYGKIDTDGKEIVKPFESGAIAMYEMHKQILVKRQKGYAMPNSISMEELLNYPVTNLSELDKDCYSSLECTYRTVIFIDGDISLDELDLDVRESTNGIIITGNLYVNGGITNECGDTGAFLIVHGNVIADFLVGGGSEIYLEGKSLIHSFVVGFYNGGTLSAYNINTICFIDSDHCCDISGKIRLKLDIFDKPDDVKKLLEIFSKEEDFFEFEDDDGEELCYVDMDEFNNHIFEDKKRLKFLSKLVKNI